MNIIIIFAAIHFTKTSQKMNYGDFYIYKLRLITRNIQKFYIADGPVMRVL